MGDVMLGRLVNEMLKDEDNAYPWGNTLSIIQNTDLRICNLECVISDKGNPWSMTPKMFHFRTDEKNIQTLKRAEIDMVSIANNHVLDYEDEALCRMIETLDKHSILHAGAGINHAQASKPIVCSKNGQKIGMIAFTDNEPEWEAGPKKPGIFYVPIDLKDKRADFLFNLIDEVRKKVDFLLVSAHWGPNWGYKPPKEHKIFAHALIDAGVDLIFGHSGHIFRGIEIYKNKPILYCAGDFIDDYAVDEIERNDESFIFVLEKGEISSKLLLYPTLISQFQAQLPIGERKEAILSKMHQLCGDLGTHMESLEDYGYIKMTLLH